MSTVITDLRMVKSELRQYYKSVRHAIPAAEKSRRDEEICRKVTGLDKYMRCRLLLTYISTAAEPDTRRLIHTALESGRTVAAPRCVPGTREIEFYEIRSLDALAPGKFGVDEPAADPRCLVTEFSRSICVTPALCYDRDGYRLGYGGGYYDRFLARYNGFAVGITYSDCIRGELPRGRFDRPVSLVVTEGA